MSRLQNYWDFRAALNFILGGAGAGLMVVLGFLQAPSPYAIALSLALIAAGLGAVWLETGRKLRALHVLFNPSTSWMTRESFAALLLFPLGLGSIFVPAGLPFAAAAAAAFLYCQARILRASKGIPAWRAPEIVPLVLATGLAEGAGLCLLFSRQDLLLALFSLALIARALAWNRYRAAVQSAALEPAGKALLQVGTAVALLLVILATLYAREAALLAAIAAIATGWWLKFALVRRAAAIQEFALPRLPVRGAR